MRTLLAEIVMVLSVMTLGTGALAQSNIGFYGIGGRLGYVMPEGEGDNAIGFGLQADLGTITKDIHLGAFIDYWGKSYDEAVTSTCDWEVSYSVIVVGAAAKYFFPAKSKIEPYAGGGLGLAIGRAKSEGSCAGLSGDESTSNTDLAFQLMGGVEYPLSPTLKGIAELKYHMSDGDYFMISAGVTYLLGK